MDEEQVVIQEKLEVVKEEVPAPKKEPISVDTERVQFVESLRLFWRGEYLNFRQGQIVDVSKEMRDILLKREAIKLLPR